jgi:hypothetical protein
MLRKLLPFVFLFFTLSTVAQESPRLALRLGATAAFINDYYGGWGDYYGYHLAFEHRVGRRWSLNWNFSMARGDNDWYETTVFEALKYTWRPQVRFYFREALRGFFLGAQIELTYLDGVVDFGSGFARPYNYLYELGAGLGLGWTRPIDPKLDLGLQGAWTAYPIDQAPMLTAEVQVGYRF